MNVTVLPSNPKWQPAVLHLLPFSTNAAGVPANICNSSNKSPSHNTSGAAPTLSYIQEEVRGFPALAISPKDREKLRAKSASMPDKHSHQQPVHPKTQTHDIKEHVGVGRAKSEYGTVSERKVECVKFSINDINEQILGKLETPGDNKKYDAPDIMGGRGDGTESKLKPFPKPTIKNCEGRRPTARFWRSSTISPGELDLQKHKHDLDIQNLKSRKSKRVKLNVKDLPRSKTPIGENDPDKLNMKHVIAFLQDNAEEKIAKENSKLCNDINSQKNKTIVKEEHSMKMVQDSSPNNEILSSDLNNNTKSVIPQSTLNAPDTFIETVTEIEETIDQVQMSSHVRNSGLPKQYSPIKRPITTSYSSNNESSFVHLYKYNKNNYDQMRPKSLNRLHDRVEFSLPANLRHIRESSSDMKSFRLHRFLTLVSNTSASVNILPVSKSHNPTIRPINIGTPYRHQSRSSMSVPIAPSPLSSNSQKDKTFDYRNESRKRSERRKSSSEVRLYHVRPHGNRDKRAAENGCERRAISQESHYPLKQELKSTLHTGKRQNVICLPVAPVDIDSDEDYKPNPTVPGRLDKKGVKLTAEGHAIIAQQFPHIKTLCKNGSRPHSVKDVIRWAEEKSGVPFDGSNQQRPHSMKNIKFEYSTKDENKEEFKTSLVSLSRADRKSNNSTDCGPNVSYETSDGYSYRAGTEGIATVDNNNTIVAPIETSVGNTNFNAKDISVSSLSPKGSDSKYIDRASLSNSSDTSKDSSKSVIVTFPTEIPDLNDNNSQIAIRANGINGASIRIDSNVTDCKNGAKSSSHGTVISGDPVKLTMRRERNLTRELTYMVDMELGSYRSGHTGRNSNELGS